MIILKRNLEERNVHITGGEDNPKELVAIDLSVGDRYRVPGQSKWFDLTGSFVLRPGRCALIRTREKMILPNNVFGCIFSRGGLSAKGLVVSNTKIDPLFFGVLHIPVFNAGRQSISLKHKERFCSAVFQTLEHPVPGNVARDPIDMDVSTKPLLFNYLDEYLPLIITGLITIIGSALATYVTIRYAPPSQIQKPSELQSQRLLEGK